MLLFYFLYFNILLTSLKVNKRSLTYVALNRVRKLEDLFLLSPVNAGMFCGNSTNIIDVMEEMKRLENKQRE